MHETSESDGHASSVKPVALVAQSAAVAKPRKTEKLPSLERIREGLVDAARSDKADADAISQAEEPFSEDALRAEWESFLRRLKDNSKDVEHATLNRPFHLDDGHTIVLEFDNAVQSIILERLQQDLVTFLRTNLKNRNINVLGKVRQQEGEKKVYTNKEKFEYLAGKYPKLRQLKDRLDLDTDF